MEAKRPKNIPEYANLCLNALSASDLGHKISLGGALGLMHYLEYRTTFDADAWWETSVTSSERQQIVEILLDALRPFGSVQIRTWGDVTSVELRSGARKVFSFQIAHRSAQLESPVHSSWSGVYLDSFADLVANKMVALVERGAPRDFLDIFTLCLNRLVSKEQCWSLWQMRQTAAESDADMARARLAIQTHLARIEQHRPLKNIPDKSIRQSAEAVRTWFKQEFLYVTI